MNESDIKTVWEKTLGQSEEHWSTLSAGATYKPADEQLPDTLSGQTLPSATLSGGDTVSDGTVSDGGTLIGDGIAQMSGGATDTAQYDILSEIGRGGMGVIYRARQGSLRRDVAIKQIIPEQANANAQGKFVSEALVTGVLDHPNIVPVHELGQTADGNVFLSMKLVGGTEWKDLLHPKTDDEKGKAAEHDEQSHISILLNVCNAIAFAHSKGIVHRDLKPENVMVGEFGEVLVMDWGIAVDISEQRNDDARAQHKSTVKGPSGTPSYMPPELAEGRGSDIGPWTDVYLLGAILHEVLTGAPPHLGNNLMAVLLAASKSEPKSYLASVPAGLQAICHKAMARSIQDRYQSIEALRAAIEEYVQHRESMLITDKADKELTALPTAISTENRNDIYGRYAKVVARYEQALELWSANGSAEMGVDKAREAYARLALAGGDLGLAAAQAAPLSNNALQAEIAKTQESRRKAAAAVKRMRLGLIVAVVLIMLGLGIGISLIIHEQSKTAAERDKAVQAEQDAQQQKTEAEKQRDIAHQARAAETEQRQEVERRLVGASAGAVLSLARGAQQDALLEELEDLCARTGTGALLPALLRGECAANGNIPKLVIPRGDSAATSFIRRWSDDGRYRQEFHNGNEEWVFNNALPVPGVLVEKNTQTFFHEAVAWAETSWDWGPVGGGAVPDSSPFTLHSFMDGTAHSFLDILFKEEELYAVSVPSQLDRIVKADIAGNPPRVVVVEDTTVDDQSEDLGMSFFAYHVTDNDEEALRLRRSWEWIDAPLISHAWLSDDGRWGGVLFARYDDSDPDGYEELSLLSGQSMQVFPADRPLFESWPVPRPNALVDDGGTQISFPVCGAIDETGLIIAIAHGPHLTIQDRMTGVVLTEVQLPEIISDMSFDADGGRLFLGLGDPNNVTRYVQTGFAEDEYMPIAQRLPAAPGATDRVSIPCWDGLSGTIHTLGAGGRPAVAVHYTKDALYVGGDGFLSACSEIDGGVSREYSTQSDFGRVVRSIDVSADGSLLAYAASAADAELQLAAAVLQGFHISKQSEWGIIDTASAEHTEKGSHQQAWTTDIEISGNNRALIRDEQAVTLLALGTQPQSIFQGAAQATTLLGDLPLVVSKGLIGLHDPLSGVRLGTIAKDLQDVLKPVTGFDKIIAGSHSYSSRNGHYFMITTAKYCTVLDVQDAIIDDERAQAAQQAYDVIRTNSTDPQALSTLFHWYKDLRMYALADEVHRWCEHINIELPLVDSARVAWAVGNTHKAKRLFTAALEKSVGPMWYISRCLSTLQQSIKNS